MAFLNSYRIEKVYFEKLKTDIELAKSYLDAGAAGEAADVLRALINVNGAVLLCYRNLGEVWADLSAQLEKIDKALNDYKDKVEEYHDELNQKIDENHNYLMALIRDLQARMEAVETDLRTMGRLITYDLSNSGTTYSLSEGTDPVTFQKTAQYFNHEKPHFVTVRGELNSEVTYLLPREYDTSASGLFEWYAFGFVGNTIHELTVTLLPDDSVNVAVNTFDFGSLTSRVTQAETDIDALEGRMDNAETDIDTLELTAENLEQNKQDKLTAGSGISIDPDTGEISATGGVQSDWDETDATDQSYIMNKPNITKADNPPGVFILPLTGATASTTGVSICGGKATGGRSVAIGGARASATNSFAIGEARANSVNSFAGGSSSVSATGDDAFAFGYTASTNGPHSVAFSSATASSGWAFAINRATASGTESFAANRGFASGLDSAAFGEQTYADQENMLVCGSYSARNHPVETRFAVGGGSTTGAYDAFRVTKDGDLILHNGTQSVTLTVQNVIDLLALLNP